MFKRTTTLISTRGRITQETRTDGPTYAAKANQIFTFVTVAKWRPVTLTSKIFPFINVVVESAEITGAHWKPTARSNKDKRIDE
jgi:hypothetical protein